MILLLLLLSVREPRRGRVVRVIPHWLYFNGVQLTKATEIKWFPSALVELFGM